MLFLAILLVVIFTPTISSVVFAIAVVVAGRGNDTTALAAQAYFWARVVYLPLYAAGVPYVRSLVWLVSLLSILALVFALL